MAEQPHAFPVPASLHDLEREPYNLLPYPEDFRDDDEAARADSFAALVHDLEQCNRSLTNMAVFEPEQEEFAGSPWMDEQRMQALYTLVRKSTSLAPLTRQGLANALSQAVHSLSHILDDFASGNKNSETAPQSFRDAFACHIYMLYSFMFYLESDAKGNSKVSDETLKIRQIAASAMLTAAQAMADHRVQLWQRGVPDEAVVILPCRIAYPMLEQATGVMARKAVCGDQAIKMIAVSLQQTEQLLSTVTAALMDLMHSFEHMAAITAELCTMVSEEPVNRLAVELIREIGRLDAGAVDAKATGIKNVAPFVTELAVVRPKLVLVNLSHLLPHLQQEPYNMRSAIVTAVQHILEWLTEQLKEPAHDAAVMEQWTKQRTVLLDLLTERVYDVSSYTRSTVMKAWLRLASQRAIPKDRCLAVTRLVADRLQDKTVLVRKQAMQVLTCLLENNPFMGSLDPAPYTNKLAELYEFVKSNMPQSVKEAHQVALEGTDGDEELIREADHAAFAAAIAEADTLMEESAGDLTDAQQEYCNKVQALRFTQSALEFIDIFEEATVALEGMLLSTNTSDVTEALRFFVRARHFKLPCAVSGMKRALALMWSTEQNIRDEVLKAFVDVFIAVPGTEGERLLPNEEIAENLLVLASEASVSEQASIEEAIVRLVHEERLPPDVFLILWSIVSKGSGEARVAAIQLLSMGAASDRTIVDSKSRLKLLLDNCLGKYTQENNDWKLAGAAALALQRVRRAKVDPSDAKFLVLEQIMEQLCDVARGDWCRDDNADDTLEWFSASEQAIKALFVISPEPEVASRDIILNLYSTTFPDGGTSCHSLRLARFFHVLGNVALNLLVYTEALSSSVRRANAKKTLAMQEEADKAKAQKGSTEADGDNEEEEAIEAELGMAAELEAETERKMAEISENEILGRGVISHFYPLLVRVVQNEGGKFNSEILMQASTLALCKLMCVSSSFCEKHLPLLFTSLASAPPEDTTMTANIVVALGDLAFRFPNEVEPYTPRIYACLQDSSTKVRRHTLMVLTHLILNDMVKVKGQVCAIAMCLRDKDPRIRDMSRLLFHELSKRSNNPVYNLLPEITSQLSQLSIKKEDFRYIMSFLLSYVKKERQNEMLTEKFCQRFPKCNSISQTADLAYSIAQLKMTEKSIKCLSDNFNLYKDSLFDEDVHKSFLSIVTKAKKAMKPEKRQFLEEWEAKMNDFAQLGAENQQADEKAARAKSRASRRAARKKQQKKKIVEQEEDDDDGKPDEFEFAGDDEVDDVTVEKENAPASKAKSRTSSRRSQRVAFSD